MLLYTYVCIIFTKITRRRFNDLSIKMEPCLLTIASAIFNCFPFHVNCSMLFFQLKITFSIANLFPDYETLPEKQKGRSSEPRLTFGYWTSIINNLVVPFFNCFCQPLLDWSKVRSRSDGLGPWLRNGGRLVNCGRSVETLRSRWSFSLPAGLVWFWPWSKETRIVVNPKDIKVYRILSVCWTSRGAC